MKGGLPFSKKRKRSGFDLILTDDNHGRGANEMLTRSFGIVSISSASGSEKSGTAFSFLESLFPAVICVKGEAAGELGVAG